VGSLCFLLKRKKFCEARLQTQRGWHALNKSFWSAEAIAVWREEGREDGLEEGLERGRAQLQETAR